MTQIGAPFIIGTLRERVVIALFSLPLTAVCVWAAVTGESVIRDFDSGSTATRSFGFGVFRLLCTDLFVAAAAFLLAFVWAVRQPRWVGGLLWRVSRSRVALRLYAVLSILLSALVLRIIEYVELTKKDSIDPSTRAGEPGLE
jgi:hypothetical protein